MVVFADMPRGTIRENAQGRARGHGATWLTQVADAFEAERDLDVWWITLDRSVTGYEYEEKAGQHFIRLMALLGNIWNDFCRQHGWKNIDWQRNHRPIHQRGVWLGAVRFHRRSLSLQ